MSNELLASIKEAAPIFEKNAAQTESQRFVSAENIATLKKLGFFKSLQPKAYGGSELRVSEYVPLVAEVAKSCSSTAWAAGLLANHAHGIALFSKDVQNEIWANDEDTLISSSVAPLGKHEKVKGGIRLTGKFGWSSGCDHAKWAILGYMGINNLGQPGPCFAVVPNSDYEILDDWDSMALGGTGSHSIFVENAFVPENRCESLFALNYGLSKGYESNNSGLYNLPFSPVFSLGFSAVSLGLANKIYDVFLENTKHRLRAYTGSKVAENASIHMRIGESKNQITAATRLLEYDWAEMDTYADKKQQPDPKTILDWRTNQAYAIKLLIQSADRLFSAAGGSAWLSSNPLQKLYRDIKITGSHAQTDYDIAAQTYGRDLLGLAADAKHY